MRFPFSKRAPSRRISECPQATTTSLLGLPTELVVDVISHIDAGVSNETESRINQRTLVSLCRVSRQVRDITQPFLYKKTLVGLSGHTAVPLARLMWTIVRRPDLGANIEELKIYIHSETSKCPKIKHIRKLLKVLHASLQQPEAKGSLPPVQLICQLLLQKGPDNALLLKSIKKIEFVKVYENSPFSLKNVIVPLRAELPTLGVITTKTLAQRRFLDDFMGIEFNASNVATPKTLSLFWARMSDKDLNKILAAYPALEAFEFKAPRPRDYEQRRVPEGIVNFTPSDLNRALTRHANSLETLNIDMHPFYVDSPFDEVIYRERTDPLSYPSFFDFTKLKRLSIEFGRLRTYKHLPESLEHLTFYRLALHEFERYFNVTKTLKDKYCPLIEELHVQGRAEGPGCVRRLCKKGVVYVHHKDEKLIDFPHLEFKLTVGYFLQEQDDEMDSEDASESRDMAEYDLSDGSDRSSESDDDSMFGSDED